MKAFKIILVINILLLNNSVFSQVKSADKTSVSSTEQKKGTSRYYYFPNLQAYFDNANMVYYYKVNNEWQTSEELPVNYGGYSLYSKSYVIIKDYDGENPQQFLNIHKKLYPYNSKGRFTNTTESSD
jgi:N-acetylneuraminic acid mutarotase